MKKGIISIVILLTLSICTYGQQRFLFEEFTDPAGSLITSYGWSQIGTTQTANPLTISSPGLSFPGLTTRGNALTMMNSGQDCSKSFTTHTSGSVYISFLMKVSSTSAGDFFIALSPSSGAATFYSKLYARTSGSGFVLGLSKFFEPVAWSTTVLNLNTTYAVVVKYTFNPVLPNDDSESLYIFTTSMPATEPSTPELTTNTGPLPDPTDLGIVTLRQGAGDPMAASLIIDEIMVSTGWSQIVAGVTKEEGTVPTDFSLSQNYPNPFNPTTQIAFSIPKTGNYTLKVFNILGKEIETLVNNEQISAGKYSVTFNARNLASGTYVYRLTGNNVNLSQKMLLVK